MMIGLPQDKASSEESPIPPPPLLRQNTKHLPSRQLNGLCAVLLKNTGRRKLLSLTKTSRDISNWETRQLNYSRIGNY